MKPDYLNYRFARKPTRNSWGRPRRKQESLILLGQLRAEVQRQRETLPADQRTASEQTFDLLVTRLLTIGVDQSVINRVIREVDTLQKPDTQVDSG